MRDLLAVKLKAAGYATIAVDNGSAALRLALTQHPDLIIVDVCMPSVDGLNVCVHLQRADSPRPSRS